MDPEHSFGVLLGILPDTAKLPQQWDCVHPLHLKSYLGDLDVEILIAAYDTKTNRTAQICSLTLSHR